MTKRLEKEKKARRKVEKKMEMYKRVSEKHMNELESNMGVLQAENTALKTKLYGVAEGVKKVCTEVTGVSDLLQSVHKPGPSDSLASPRSSK